MAALNEPGTPRPVRKIKSPTRPPEKTGLRWDSASVPRIYLDDIEAIFEVMQEYSKHSPFVRLMQQTYEVSRDGWEARHRAYEKLEQVQGVSVEGQPLAEPPPEPPEPPVEIETDKYKEIYSIEALTNLNETKAREVQMSVGGLDLLFRFTPGYCSVTTLRDDVPSTEAFNKIKGLLEERSVKIIGLIQSRVFWLPYAIVLTVALVLYQFFRIVVLGWIYVFLLLFPFILWPFIFGVWDRRPNVVTLEYRRDSPTFLEDHLADIVKWVIITVVAGVLLLLATRAINQIWPEGRR
jgi:hypothetical protein